MTGTRQIDKLKIVQVFPPGVPSSASPVYVDLANYNHCTLIIEGSNAGSGITPVAVTLNQATNVSAGSAKALAFSTMFAITDVGAGDLPTQTAVVSNTFTCTSTVSKNFQYVIEIDASNLDVANLFSCLQIGLANGAAQTLSVTALLSGARYAGGFAGMPSAIV